MNINDYMNEMFDLYYTMGKREARQFSITGIDIEALKALPINEEDLLNNGTGFVYDFDTDCLTDIVLMLRVAVELFKQTTEKADTLKILVDKGEIKTVFNKTDEEISNLLKEIGFIHDRNDNRFIAGGESNTHCLFTFTPEAEKAIKQC